MFLTLWTFFACSAALTAQTEKENQQIKDTIIFTPDAQTKVILTGDELKQMVKYKKIDSLKLLFISDLEEARKQPAFPVNSKTTYYFVSANGKRRLKAESEDYTEQEINIATEKKSLDLNLPPYEYIIYDFSNNYECHIYLKDPEQISALKNINFGESFTAIEKNKKLMMRNYRVDLAKEDNRWKVKDSASLKSMSIYVGPAFGMSLIGSKASPMINVNAIFEKNYKNGIPFYKFGIGYTANVFTEMTDKKLSDLTLLSSYEIKYMLNYNLRTSNSKPKWIGPEIGWLTEQHNGPLNNKFKAGIIMDGVGPVGFSFDVIFLQPRVMTGITVRLNF